MRHLCLLLLCALWGGALAAHDNSFCTITQTSTGSLPNAPPSYNVALSMTDNDGRRISAFEYYDSSVQKSTFQTYFFGGGFRAIVNFGTNQVQLIGSNDTRRLLDSCQVQDIPAGEILTEIVYLGKSYYLPSKFFFGDSSIKIEAQSQETVNGVVSNKFFSCYYVPSTDRSLQITWYFNARTTTDPVRVIINAKDNSKGTIIQMTHDISRFGAGNPPWPSRMNPYMAPAGLYCRNLKFQGRKPMTLPNKFSMRIERIALGSTTSTYMREAYDFNANMSMLVGYPPEGSGDGAKYGAGRLLYIHDFVRGLSYIRNEDMGNCTYERLSDVDWDSQKDGNQMRIRTPREFFDLDSDNVQYKGTGFTRDLQTDIFINYKQLDIGSGIKVDTTVEWYFANRTVVDSNGVKSNQSVPLSALISSDASWLSSWMYIYDFDTTDPVFNRHDIAACFNNDAKLHFQVYFPLADDKVTKYVQTRPNDFTSVLVPNIAAGLNVSPLRVLDPEVTVRGNIAILEITVTDKPRFQTNTEETPLNEIEAAMNILINKRDIFAFFGLPDGSFATVTANRVSVVEERTSNLKSIGYSAGVLVGIGFVMALLGLAIGVGVVFGIYKFRGGTLLGLDPFQPQRL